MSQKQKHPLWVYDITVYNYSYDLLMEWAVENCKRLEGQEEICPTSKREHFQGRFSLKEKKYLKTIPNNIKANFSITSDENKDNTFYCMKNRTRKKDGFQIIYNYKDIKVETKQLRLFKSYKLRNYQDKIINMCKEFDMRTIDLIFDPVGNIGKSIFTEYCESLDLVEEIPPYRLMDDIFQWVHSRPKKKAYFFDLPRGMKKDKLGDLYAGIEIIKNGCAYDKRYTAKKIRFDRPRIFVFTNVLPEFNFMSKDRWNVWQITEDYDMIKWNSFQGGTSSCNNE